MTRWDSWLLRARSVRVRVTLWYLAILLAVLIIAGVVVYVGLGRSLRAEMDHALDLVAVNVADTSNRGRPELDRDKLPPEYRATLYALDGSVLETAPRGEVLPLGDAPRSAAIDGRETRDSADLQGQSWRVLTRPVTWNGRVVGVLQVGRSEQPIDVTLDQLRLVLQALVPLALLLAGSVGLFLAGRALDPIDRMTRTAAAIGAEDLSRRLPADVRRTPDEVGRLASTFNHMLDRLERAFERQRQFTADASHELRTPLSLLLTQLDVALARPCSGHECRSVFLALREDVVHMQRLVQALLTLARADAGKDPGVREPLDLSDLARQVVQGLSDLADERGVLLGLEVEEGVTVYGSDFRLMQLIANLVENGIEHTPAGGSVSVSVSMQANDSTAMLEVRDTGTGIAAQHLPHVFERFYRADPARSDGGLGLGLSICQSIAEGHGGSIRAESRPGAGSTFKVILPARHDAGAVRGKADIGVPR
jgi:heavy metal sensor kinase